MKKFLFILIVILVLIGGIVWLLTRQSAEPQGDTAGGSSTTTAAFPAGATTTLSSVSTEKFTSQNFLQNPDISIDPDNPDQYFLGNTHEQSAVTDAPLWYVITYQKSSQFFNVVLLKQPLGEARGEAEFYLQYILGLPPDQMCALRYAVSTPLDVDKYFSGKDLKFSFCQGATQL